MISTKAKEGKKKMTAISLVRQMRRKCLLFLQVINSYNKKFWKRRTSPNLFSKREGNMREIIWETIALEFIIYGNCYCPHHVSSQPTTHKNDSNQSQVFYRLSGFRIINCLKLFHPRLWLQVQWRKTSNFRDIKIKKKKLERANRIVLHLKHRYQLFF